MAITFGGVGTQLAGGGVTPFLLPIAPASGANYINFLLLTWKATDVPEPAVSSGGGPKWYRLDLSRNSVLEAAGVDVGSMAVSIWYSYGTAPTGTTIQWQGTVGSCTAVIFNYVKSSTEAWIVKHAVGVDNTSGANYSASATTSVDATVDDVIVSCTGLNTDEGTITAEAITAVGLTFGSINSRILNQISTSNDAAVVVYDATVTAGTQTDVTVNTFSNASANYGASIHLRLRVATAPDITVTPVDSFYTEAGYDVSVTGLTPFSKFHVYRGDSSGDHLDVRGGQIQSVSEIDDWAAVDYEFSFGHVDTLNWDNNIVYYVAVLDDSSVVTFTNHTTVNAFEDWEDSLEDAGVTKVAAAKTFLSIPDTPSLNTPVLIQEYQSYDRSGNILSKSHVLGRSNPVVNSDVLSGRTGKLSILISGDLSVAAGGVGVVENIKTLIEALKIGQVCLIRHIQPAAVGWEDIFFVSDGITVNRANASIDESRLYSRVADIDTHLIVEITFVEVDRPDSTTAVAEFSWQSVMDGNLTWNTVLTGNADWLQVLQTGV
jgi:hypothetical protein